MSARISIDFRRLLEIFNRRQVRYLVVGGYAQAVYARPRFTKNLDLWLDSSQPNAGSVLLSLEEFGFGTLGLKTQDFTQEGYVIQLGHQPNRIDLLTSLQGLKFSECFERRQVVEVTEDGLTVNLINHVDLIHNKKAVGRKRDLADIEELELSLSPEDLSAVK